MSKLKLLYDLARYKKNARLPLDKMKKLQKKRLDKILLYAYQHSDYYHKAFLQYGITEENITKTPLAEFPTIDKEILMNNFDRIVTVNDLTQAGLAEFDEQTELSQKLFKNKYHVVHSSGSTGTPRYFVYDENAWNEMLVGMLRAALWNMSMPQILKFIAKRPRILYVAATDGRYGGAMAVGDGIEGCGAKQMFLDINTPLSEWVDKIQKFNPNMIVGYPSAIKIVAELAEKKQISVNVMRVDSCGEPLTVGLRDYIRSSLDAEIINFYGASESIALGVEDDFSDGIYLFDDMNVVEVIDGQMYLTVLYNFSQPIIRYRLSDKLILKNPDMRYPFTRSEAISGRDEDLLWFEDGHGGKEFIHPLSIEGFCIDGLVDYQFQKNTADSFEMLAEVPDISKRDYVRFEMLKQMSAILDEKKLTNVQFYVRFADKILPDAKTGKKRLVIQNVT